MGTWGPKLYEDDIAAEIREFYIEQLRRGKEGTDVTEEIIKKYHEELKDYNEYLIIWLALADTQWDLGRLEPSVKEKALSCIEKGADFERWAHDNPNCASERRQILIDLKNKLLSPQPNPKRIAQYRIYHCPWKVGDIYAYKLSGDYAKEKGLFGKNIFFVKVDEEIWHPGHVIPVVYCFWVMSETLLSNIELTAYPYIPQFYSPIAYELNPKLKKSFLLSFLSTSAKVIPKANLTYIGRLEKIARVKNENLVSYKVHWKDFEKYIIDIFQMWDK